MLRLILIIALSIQLIAALPLEGERAEGDGRLHKRAAKGFGGTAGGRRNVTRPVDKSGESDNSVPDDLDHDFDQSEAWNATGSRYDDSNDSDERFYNRTALGNWNSTGGAYNRTGDSTESLDEPNDNSKSDDRNRKPRSVKSDDHSKDNSKEFKNSNDKDSKEDSGKKGGRRSRNRSTATAAPGKSTVTNEAGADVTVTVTNAAPSGSAKSSTGLFTELPAGGTSLPGNGIQTDLPRNETVTDRPGGSSTLGIE